MELCQLKDKSNNLINCPLVCVQVDSTIFEKWCEVKINQVYINSNKSNIEAIYTFPMPHNAEISSFKVKLNDNNIVGEFREKEEAYELYNKEILKGNSGFLLESTRNDIFTISIGNILPDEKVDIEIIYTQEIKQVDNEVRWILPTCIAPRYIPGNITGIKTGYGIHEPTDIVPDADYITPPIGDAPYFLKLKINVIDQINIEKIESVSHEINSTIVGENYIITLKDESVPLNSDFVLKIIRREEAFKSLFISESNDDKFGFLSYKFEQDESVDVIQTVQSNEYIFMIDVSGSMQGTKLEQAKLALKIALRNLEENDYFNIISFETRYYLLNNKSLKYSQSSLDKADKWIEKLVPLGGTEIYDPLKFVLTDSNTGLHKIILLFTDGEVGNESQIVSLIKEYSNSVSIFPFGIDTCVNMSFIDNIAASGNGLSEYVYPGERVDDKIIRQFSRIQQSYVENLKIMDADENEYEVFPSIPKRIYPEDMYTFYINLEKIKLEDGIIVTGIYNNKKFQEVIMAKEVNNFNIFSKAWAKAKIIELENIQVSNKRREDIIKKEIIDLSIRYNILSKYTSLVSILQRKSKIKSHMETVVIAVDSPAKWDMFDNSNGMDYMCFECGPLPMEAGQVMASNIEEPNLSKKMKFRSAAPNFSVNKDRNVFSKIKGVLNKNEDIESLIRDVAKRQMANGSFNDKDGEKTIIFIYLVLSLPKLIKQYKKQIIKSLNYLIKTSDKNKILKTGIIQKAINQKLCSTDELKQYIIENLKSLNESEISSYNDFVNNDDMSLFKSAFLNKLNGSKSEMLISLVKMI